MPDRYPIQIQVLCVGQNKRILSIYFLVVIMHERGCGKWDIHGLTPLLNPFATGKWMQGTGVDPSAAFGRYMGNSASTESHYCLGGKMLCRQHCKSFIILDQGVGSGNVTIFFLSPTPTFCPLYFQFFPPHICTKHVSSSSHIYASPKHLYYTCSFSHIWVF